MTTQQDVRSSRVPGGSLLTALLNRQVMTLADRGSSSALVGDRWADLAAAHAGSLVGSAVSIPGAGQVHVVDRVVRLDDDHRIARRASRNGLQNPDLLFFGTSNGHSTVQAVDAKFSVETARSKQVSIEMMEGLIGLGDFFDQAVGGIDRDARIVPGLFLSPDTAFTRYVVGRGRGITRLTVSTEEMLLIDVTSLEMFSGIDGHELLDPLFQLDGHDAHPLQNMLSGLYYFRLARAASASWIDEKRPLLALNDVTEVDVDAVLIELKSRSARSSTACEVIISWADDAERVNRQRAAIDRVSGLPVTGRELREWVLHDAGAVNANPPSMNQVCRRLGAWYRGEIRDRLGPVPPPVPDLGPVLLEIGQAARELAPRLRAKTVEIVQELAVVDPDDDGEMLAAQNSRSEGETR